MTLNLESLQHNTSLSVSFIFFTCRTVVTVYAFDGNSTFKFSSLNLKKEFIWRYDMLGKLRKDIYGTDINFMLIFQLVIKSLLVQHLKLIKFCCQCYRKSK